MYAAALLGVCAAAVTAVGAGSAPLCRLRSVVPLQSATAGLPWVTRPIIEAVVKDWDGSLVVDTTIHEPFGVFAAVYSVNGTRCAQAPVPACKLAGGQDRIFQPFNRGVANFSISLSVMAAAGDRVVLQFTSPIASNAVLSNAFNVTRAAGTAPAVIQQPLSGPAGAPVAGPVRLAFADGGGNVDPAARFNATLTALTCTNAAGTPLTACTANYSAPHVVTAVDGIASLAPLVVWRTGWYIVNATLDLDPAAHNCTAVACRHTLVSAVFHIQPSPDLSLRLLAQPGASVAGQPFSPQPVVEVVDTYGNAVDGDTAVGLSVVVDLLTAPATVSPADGLSSLQPGVVTERVPVDACAAAVVRGSDVITVAGGSIGSWCGITGGDSLLLRQCAAVVPPTARSTPQDAVVIKQLLQRNSVAGTAAIRLTAAFAGDSAAGLCIYRLRSGLAAPISASGVARFQHLYATVAGAGYALRFRIAHACALSVAGATSRCSGSPAGPVTSADRNATAAVGALAVASDAFDVIIGPPAALLLLAPLRAAWGGNQPLSVQPSIAVVDAGGNRVPWVSGPSVAVTIARQDTGNFSLTGQHETSFVDGVADFQHVGVAPRMLTEPRVATLLFSAHIPGYAHLTTTASLPMYPSAEWLLSPRDIQDTASPAPASLLLPGTRFGHAVAVMPPFAAVGAVQAARPEPDVFQVSVSGSASTYSDQTQMLVLAAEWLPEQQRVAIYVPPAPGQLPCDMEVTWRTQTTRPISPLAPLDYIKNVIEADLLAAAGGDINFGVQGETVLIDITDARNDDCEAGAGCRAFVITFSNVFGDVPLLQVANISVNNCSSVLTSVGRVQPATRLNGTFTLQLPAPGSTHQAAVELVDYADPSRAHPPVARIVAETRPLPVDAPVAVIAAAVEQDLGIERVTVWEEFPFAPDDLSFAWQMGQRLFKFVFAADERRINLPTLVPNAVNVTGNGASAGVVTVIEGRGPVTGAFRLAINDTVVLAPLPFNASAAAVAAAFEAAGFVDVQVASAPVAVTGDVVSSWVVTLPRTLLPWNSWDDAATPWITRWSIAQLRSLPVCADGTPATATQTCSFLLGTSAAVTVAPAGMSPFAYSALSPEHYTQASVGHRAGAVCLFDQAGLSWSAQGCLQTLSTHEQDAFGHAVALATVQPTGTVAVVVGAPGARTIGQWEVQALSCNATSGSLSLSYKGAATGSIPFNATLSDVAVELMRLPTLNRVAIDKADASTPFCSAAALPLQITFVAPVDGELPLVEQHAADMARVLYVERIVAGEAKLSGNDTTGAAAGAVYVFTAPDATSARQATWKLQARLHGSLTRPGDLFGWSVSAAGTGAGGSHLTMAVGAPGQPSLDSAIGEAGAVYVYSVADGAAIGPAVQRIAPDGDRITSEAGMRFGWSVSLGADGDTLAIGAPGFQGAGIVMTYKRQPTPDDLYFLDQVLYPSMTAITSQTASFGFSVSLANRVLAVGAPTARAAPDDVAQGAVALFNRTDWGTRGGYLAHLSTHFASNHLDPVFMGASVAASDAVVVTAASGELAFADFASLSASIADEPETPLTQPTFLVRMRVAPGDGARCQAQLASDFVIDGSVSITAAGAPGPLNATRRLPWAATARAIRSAVAEDLGLAVNVEVLPVDGCVGNLWFLTLLPPRDLRIAVRGGLPAQLDSLKLGVASTLLVRRRSDTTDLSLAAASPWSTPPPSLASIDVEVVALPYSRSTSTGHAVALLQSDGRFLPTAALVAHDFQASDGYGASAAIAADGSLAIVGSPSRTAGLAGSQPYLRGTTGAAFAVNLSPLNVDVGRRFNPDDMSSLLSFAKPAQALSMSTSLDTLIPRTSTVASVPVCICCPACIAGSTPGPLAVHAVAQLMAVGGDEWGWQHDLSAARRLGLVARLASRFPATSLTVLPSMLAAAATRSFIDETYLKYQGEQLEAALQAFQACLAAADADSCAFVRASTGTGTTTYVAGGDPQALSDFVQGPITTTAGIIPNTSLVLPVIVLNNGVVEEPGKFFHVRAGLPGLQAVFGGRLWAPIHIDGNTDAFVDGKLHFEVTGPSLMLGAAETTNCSASLAWFDGARLGAAVARVGPYALVGAPTMRSQALRCIIDHLSLNVTTTPAAASGVVFVMQEVMHSWDVLQVVSLPALPAGALCGAALSGSMIGGRLHIGIGCPGAAAAAVVQCNVSAAAGNASCAPPELLAPLTDGWIRDSIRALAPPLQRMPSPSDGFGQDGSIALSADPAGLPMLVVGAAGLDTVYIFRRSGASPLLPWECTAVIVEHNSDTSLASFGSSLAFDGRQLAVGAPGAQVVLPGERLQPGPNSTIDGATDSSFSLAGGAVYVYAAVWQDQFAAFGGATTALEVDAAACGAPATTSGCTRSVIDAWEDVVWLAHHRLEPVTATAGGRFGESVAVDGSVVVVGEPLASAPVLSTWDFETGDLRGWSTVGAAFAFQPTYGDNAAFRPEYSNVVDNFTAVGTGMRGRYFVSSFDFRPRDSAANASVVDSADSVLAAVAGAANVVVAPNDTAAGTAVGDLPTGMLQSQPFMIKGTTISFLVGGGCDLQTVFVELVIDGFARLRATGACSNRMRTVTWPVAAFLGQSAFIRVVDVSSRSPWGHISVDAFSFDWEMVGPDAPAAGAVTAFVLFEPAPATVDAGENPEAASPLYVTTVARPTTILSAVGVPAAAAPRTRPPLAKECARIQRTQCAYLPVNVLHASDMRPGANFGAHVSLAADAGLLLVSGLATLPAQPGMASPAGCVGHACGSAFTAANASSPRLPVSASMGTSSNIELRSSWPSAILGGSAGATGPDTDATAAARSSPVYLFQLLPQRLSGDGRLVQTRLAQCTEHARLLLPVFGTMSGFVPMAVDAFSGTLGVPSDSRMAEHSGVVAALDLSFVHVSFSPADWLAASQQGLLVMPRMHLPAAGAAGDVGEAAAFGTYIAARVLENATYATLAVYREGLSMRNDPRSPAWLLRQERLVVGYTTRDITAVGISAEEYKQCIGPDDPLTYCGDYLQTSGYVVLDPDDYRAEIHIPLLNNALSQPTPRTFAVDIWSAGGVGIASELYTAAVQIEDDDL